MRARSLALLLLPALVATAAPAGDDLTGVPLQWRPTSRLSESMGPLNLLPFAEVKVQLAPLTDARPDKAVIGENLQEEEPRLVSTRDDVAAFLTAQIGRQLKEAGLPIVAQPDPGATILSAEVLRFKVTERQTFKGELSLLFEVRSKGKVLWRGTVMGDATRFGRSFKLENYQETLSDSLIDALGKLLKSQEFLSALAGKGPAI